MMTKVSPSPRAQNLLIALLYTFSISLALSKSAVNVVMTLTYVTAIVCALRYKDFRSAVAMHKGQPLVLPLLLYIAVACVGVLYSENRADGLGIVNKIAGLLLVYYMAAVLIETTREQEKKRRLAENLVLIFIAGIFVLDVIGALTFVGIIGNRKYSLPLYPMHVHHIWFSNLNALGIYAACSFLLFGGVPQHSRKMNLLIAFIAVAVLCILLSISRTAWIGMIATTIILTYVYARKKRTFFLVLAVVLIGCLMVYQFVPLVHDRVNVGFSDIRRYAEGTKESSMGHRFIMWKAAADMFLSNPLFGVGTGDYMTTAHRYVEAGSTSASLLAYNQPHNMYLFALATTGLVGLAALLFVFYSIFRHARAEMRGERQAGFFAFIAIAAGIHFMVGGLTDSFFNIQILRTAFAFLLGVCIRTEASSDSRSSFCA